MLTSVQLPFGKTIFQTRGGHSITSDSAFLVETVSEQISQENINLLELGSGNGIISIMLSHYHPKLKIMGIEIQRHLVKLSQDNTKLSKTSSTFIEADLRAFTSSRKYDLIISNPPYFPKDKGRISPIVERAISRHETTCNILDIMKCVRRNLKKDGNAFILYPQNREQELYNFAKKVDLKARKKFVLDSEKKKKKIIVELVHA
ncbi:MAG: methyltransferase [Candidatus Cloacimonadota bacterium]|nr:methyltransferase [Candidatus Cloacimonadota bacterium]